MDANGATLEIFMGPRELRIAEAIVENEQLPILLQSMTRLDHVELGTPASAGSTFTNRTS